MILSRLKFHFQDLQKKLWIKPFGNAVLAIIAVYIAHIADSLPLSDKVPDIDTETVEKLLTVISGSMLGVATFAVASMVSAYSSAGGSASPRAFNLIISDGLSQTALSTFIGAFIFSIVGIIAIKVGYFAIAGRFAIFIFTIAIFAWVIFTFVRWVDNIARLGRLGNTIDKVDAATRNALEHWNPSAPLEGQPLYEIPEGDVDLYSEKIGYIQHIDTGRLESWAKEKNAILYVRSLPGAYVHPERIILTIKFLANHTSESLDELIKLFVVSERRSFYSDPRFGLIVLSEIGSRALSPGINDPGTAIDVVVRMSRILREWINNQENLDNVQPKLERVFVPPLNAQDLIEDAFAAINKDGVDSIEVGIWIQKSLALLTTVSDLDMSIAALDQANLAFARAKERLSFPYDLERIKKAHACLKQR